MTFTNPAVLLALLAVPVLVALYVTAQRRGRRAAEAFAAPAFTPSVAPSRPGWRRHAPMLVVLVAIAALIVAAARPRTSVAVPAEQASIVLATDISGSMLSTDVAPSRLVAAQKAAESFVAQVPKRVKIGVIAFNQVPRVLEAPTTDRPAVTNALESMRVSGSTATGEAIQTATRLLRSGSAATASPPPAAIVLLSDGVSVKGIDPVQAAQAAGKLRVPIYTVTLGTAGGTITVTNPDGSTQVKPVPPDPATLQRIAQVSGGKAYTAADSGHLSQVYQDLGSRLGRRTEQRELTSGFAGGALVLLLIAGASSLRWFGRLI